MKNKTSPPGERRNLSGEEKLLLLAWPMDNGSTSNF